MKLKLLFCLLSDCKPAKKQKVKEFKPIFLLKGRLIMSFCAIDDYLYGHHFYCDTKKNKN